MNKRLLLIPTLLIAAIAVSLATRHAPAPQTVSTLDALAPAASGATTTGIDVVQAPAPIPLPAAFATLIVGDDRYSIRTHGTVLDAMRSLASDGLAFTGKDYPSLGFFVESVNGKKASGGYYWILYVNGKSSDTGASQTRLSAGDTVEWRFEKSY